MNRLLPAVLIALSASALAARTTVTVSGQTVQVDSTVIGGQTYINLKQLQTALSAAGGADQKASVTGCVNEPLFNGIWRLRVTKVEAVADPDGGSLNFYHIVTQISNGTNRTLSPDSTGIQTGNAYNIFLADGDSIAAPTGTSVAFQTKTWAKLPQGSGENLEFWFRPSSNQTLDQMRANMPKKFLFEVLPDKLDKSLKVGYTVRDPSFRVNLTCTK
ncbi:hypothetical protein MF271_06280 [Deinococcus sp. KNUC1210]|uniref:hypothetical protein n=1 Tax=Deinococcus sp. KNUC1210 TaxID=2917691 RepID=UPI001EF14902|nr:hypothetical protein [Deinococcus sp. KNUC1210]ULH16217.1 hypothetical protein MF271_06280 [Deinococcus sp. KNUC1210]